MSILSFLLDSVITNIYSDAKLESIQNIRIVN